ncbi:Fic family protein [Pseudarcicella hirudinis]|uniref:Fic family protein n=1 Tax=Pseudarcicella hirudinis TaxID=1079859 RepID=A0A1I5SPE3_9BACT|nr:Fic family protein [Pseudarcicella hirudinis]SFP72511.1 Fic family protein [Pseudarcicella hirudinis]
MKPPYEITTEIIKQIISISEKIGEINAKYLNRQSPQLRKQNKVKTIHSSLQIEGNTLTEQQITAIIENKRVLGPAKDILEVKNALDVYDKLSTFDPLKEKHFLSAHKILMKDLIPNAGNYRNKSVGIVKGSKVEHIAPPFENVPFLMKDLFDYLKKDQDVALIKSCVFHYEMEFIHPFMDGNGRMGRLWQTVILMKKYPVFEFLPFETLISQNQEEYYKALAASDNQGKSTIFIEYMLNIINQSLATLLDCKNQYLKDTDRLAYFISNGKTVFTRKDYMTLFKDISSATASRDLRKGIESGLLAKSGDKILTIYKVLEK